MPPETFQLKDGTIVAFRPIRSDDAPRLQGLFRRLSRQSAYFRFLGYMKELSDEQATRMAGVDGKRAAAVAAVCLEGGEEKILGVARYALPEAPGASEAEFAIAVEDRYQGQGLGLTLLKALVSYACNLGIRAFLATVNAENTRMLRFLEGSGLPVRLADRGQGVLTFRIDLEGPAKAPKRPRAR
ncbi:MAG: GNAT family protein [Anaerolineales bacterium]|jgi:acetyltransferase